MKELRYALCCTISASRSAREVLREGKEALSAAFLCACWIVSITFGGLEARVAEQKVEALLSLPKKQAVEALARARRRIAEAAR